tara:strand:+ start:313 stop:1263 length:951 start_codon:yes stop_codon:yes gene_type:complete
MISKQTELPIPKDSKKGIKDTKVPKDTKDTKGIPKGVKDTKVLKDTKDSKSDIDSKDIFISKNKYDLLSTKDKKDIDIKQIKYYNELWDSYKPNVINDKDIYFIVSLESKQTKKTKKTIGGYSDFNIIIRTTDNTARTPIDKPNAIERGNYKNLIDSFADFVNIPQGNYNRYHYQSNRKNIYLGVQRDHSVVIRCQDPNTKLDLGHLNIGRDYYPHYTFMRNDRSKVHIYFKYSTPDFITFKENIDRLLFEVFFDYTETNRTILQSSGAIRDMVEAEYIARIIHTQRNLFSNDIGEFYAHISLVPNHSGIGYNPNI